MNSPGDSTGTPRALRKYGDPLVYYQEHYAGLTRGELSRRDPSLYRRLRRDGLLEHIPAKIRRFGKDPLAYYRAHYAGLTRGELQRRDSGLSMAVANNGETAAKTVYEMFALADDIDMQIFEMVESLEAIRDTLQTPTSGRKAWSSTTADRTGHLNGVGSAAVIPNAPFWRDVRRTPC